MQVLQSRFQLNDERVWFGKAKLLADRMVLKGLGYHRSIMLDDIVEVRWVGSDLVIVRRNGEEIDMNIKAATLWKYELQARCGLKAVTDEPAAAPSKPREPVSDPAPQLDVKPFRDSSRSDDAGNDARNEDAPNENGKTPGDQTDLFLQRESTYRIRNGFAEDRPQHPKRAEDQDQAAG